MMLIIDTIYAEKSSVTFTPFDISFSEKDFTKMGPSHQILILKPGDTATIPVKIKNYDTVQHQITFSSPNVNLGSLFDSYYFEPETILVKPSSEQETLLHMKIKDNTDIHMSVVSLLAQSESFGMVGKYFYVVVAEKDKITEADLVDVDRSLREDLPGPAFPNLYNDFRTQPPELQNVLDKITINKFGVPRYLPNGYSFQGLTKPYPHPGFVYAPTKVTNTTESVDFWRSGGLLVGYETNTLNFNLTTWLPGYVAQNEAQQIIVNGLVGVATQQQERVTIEGYKYKFPAEIVLFDKYSEIYLRGNMPLEELLKVAESIPVPVTENPPLILSKVELWGPSSFVANDVKSCVDNTVGQLGPWAVGWIEIQNTRDKTITAQDIAFRTGSIQSIIPITLEPNESCVIQTEDQVTTRIGPGGSEGNGPPHGYDGSAVVFEYFVEENSKKIRYVDTTPEISDTFGDARIWQFVDGKWIFKETQPSLEDLLNRARQNIQPAIMVDGVIISPLKQFKSGIKAEEIQCKTGLERTIKINDFDRFYCVSADTKQILIKRGWAFDDSKACRNPIDCADSSISLDRTIYPPTESDSELKPQPSTTIEISFGKPTASKLLPVVFSEITTNTENLDEITVWNFELIGHSGDDRRVIWDTVPRDTGIFYEITDDSRQDIIDHTRMPENWAISADQHVYNMDCGVFHTITGESARPSSFPIKNNTYTINAKNSWMGIYPNSDGEYSFEFASIFETSVKLPQGAEIISQESKHCKLTQNIEEDSEGKYTDGYYTKMVFRLE